MVGTVSVFHPPSVLHSGMSKYTDHTCSGFFQVTNTDQRNETIPMDLRLQAYFDHPSSRENPPKRRQKRIWYPKPQFKPPQTNPLVFQKENPPNAPPKAPPKAPPPSVFSSFLFFPAEKKARDTRGAEPPGVRGRGGLLRRHRGAGHRLGGAAPSTAGEGAAGFFGGGGGVHFRLPEAKIRSSPCSPAFSLVPCFLFFFFFFCFLDDVSKVLFSVLKGICHWTYCYFVPGDEQRTWMFLAG